jgi:NADH-quinone oxidoreductase subunit L
MSGLLQQFPPGDFAILGLVLFLPLLGAFVNGVFGKRLGRDGVRTMALAAIGGSFILSVVTFMALVSMPHEAGQHARLVWKVWDWFSVTGQLRQDVTLEVAFSVDALSATMMLIVTGIGFLIHLYSTEYMAKDPGYYRYFAYLNLFIFSMMVLILGDNLAVLFVGWEGVGLCSYLLIGFWFDDEKKAAAGKKAFITNRIGDFGLLVAMAMLIYYVGTLSWDSLESSSVALTQARTVWPLGNLKNTLLYQWIGDAILPDSPIRIHAATLVSVFLFIGCVGKSAQVPLYVWLPDAMAGPTPVSALIHAATMVTAGVYLIARCSFIFALSPFAMALVAVTGAVTALFAATIALTQNDLKKVLAYSTVSQLGFMFIGVGVGAFAAGFFHVITHAFFKGCLFLCAGSVIHAMHARIHDDEDSQDMRNMGGLRKFMPITHAAFFASCLAIAGAPFTSGFFSKDELLYKAFTSSIPGRGDTMWHPPPWFGQAIYAVGVLAALGTAFYMFRAYFLTFHGDFRGWAIVRGWRDPHADGDHHDDHDEEEEDREGPTPLESPWQMYVPLIVLATFAVFGGFLYAEPLGIKPLEHFWAPVFAKASTYVQNNDPQHAMMVPLLGVGSAVFFVGAGAAYWVYKLQDGAPAARLAESMPRLHKLVQEKWRIDELYDLTVLGLVDAMGETAAQFDKWVIDGVLARVTSAIVQLAGTILSAFQTGRVQVYAAAMVIGTAGIGWYFTQPHAIVELDETRLRAEGDLTLQAAPGHGYAFRWYNDGEDPPEDFTKQASFTTHIRRCETKRVHLEVKNAVGQVTHETFDHCREILSDCCKDVGEEPPALPNIPGVIPPEGTGAEPKIPKVPKLPPPGTYDAGVLQRLLPGGKTAAPREVPAPPTPRKGGSR